MRFGSIRAFLKFIKMLEGVGYTCQHPLYDIEEGIKRLPDFISKYKVIITPIETQLNIGLYRDSKCYYEIYMEAPL